MHALLLLTAYNAHLKHRAFLALMDLVELYASLVLLGFLDLAPVASNAHL